MWRLPLSERAAAAHHRHRLSDVSGRQDVQRDELVRYCLAKPGAEETYPWGEEELVAKVGGKGFAFISLGGGTVSVKCGRDAGEAGEGRDPHPRGLPHSHHL